MMKNVSSLPVAVIGAGPIGLAAAAHLAERDIPFIVFEAGPAVGHNLSSYRHVRLFSPWRFNSDHAAVRLLESEGWSAPDPDLLPTAGAVVDDYLVPISRHARIAPHLHVGTRVVGVSRVHHDKVKSVARDDAPFVLQTESSGRIREHRASAVIDATGTWSQPNPLGAHGLFAVGECESRTRIFYGMPDFAGALSERYRGLKVLVVGAGHSAIGNLIALADIADRSPTTRIAWALRRSDLRSVTGGGANDGLPARGALGMKLQKLIDDDRLEVHRGFFIDRIETSADGQLRIVADDSSLATIEGIDEIVVSTGSRPDLAMVRELRLRFDPLLESTDALAPLIDPNLHSCGTVKPHGHRELQHPEPGYYAIGAKSYGRAPNFLMATGYEQARSVVAALAGDLVAADDVQLELPETGVCSTDFQVDDAGRIADCCGGPATEPAMACCATDEAAKAEGESGCGCSSTSAARVTGDSTAPSLASVPLVVSIVAPLKNPVSLPGIKIVAASTSCCAPVKD